MASYPSRQTASFDAIKPVSSLVLLDNEFDAQSGASGYFKGGTTGVKFLFKSSDAADPPLEIDQTGAGPLAEWKQNGVLKASITNPGVVTGAGLSLTADDPAITLVDTSPATTGTIVNAGGNLFFTRPGGPQDLKLDLSTGVITFGQQPVLPREKTAWSVSWFYADLPGAVETTESVGRFIVPAGQELAIIQIKAVWAGGSDSGASNIFTIKRRDSAGTLQADVGTIDVNTPAQNALGTNDIADLPLTAGDQIYPLFTTRNTASEQLVTITLWGTQKFTS